VDILNNGLYFLKFSHNKSECTYLSIFDPVSVKILKEKMMDNTCCDAFQINNNKNLIALECYNEINHSLVIINLDLEIVQEKKIKFFRDANESFIFVSKCNENENGIEITMLDWSLNEIKSFEFKPLISCCYRFKSLKDKLIVQSEYYERNLKIFDENAFLLKDINLDYSFKLLTSSNENIILLPMNNKKLIYLNFNGDLLKEIKLIDYNINWETLVGINSKGIIKFDKNDEIASILDYSRLVIFNLVKMMK
jgi:hypothetical protein